MGREARWKRNAAESGRVIYTAPPSLPSSDLWIHPSTGGLVLVETKCNCFFSSSHLPVIGPRIDLNGHQRLRDDPSFPGPALTAVYVAFSNQGPIKSSSECKRGKVGDKLIASNYTHTTIHQVIWNGRRLLEAPKLYSLPSAIVEPRGSASLRAACGYVCMNW